MIVDKMRAAGAEYTIGVAIRLDDGDHIKRGLEKGDSWITTVRLMVLRLDRTSGYFRELRRIMSAHDFSSIRQSLCGKSRTFWSLV